MRQLCPLCPFIVAASDPRVVVKKPPSTILGRSSTSPSGTALPAAWTLHQGHGEGPIGDGEGGCGHQEAEGEEAHQ